MSQKDQITELNTWVKTKLGPSKVHGVGVFALRDIPKGQKLYTEMYPRIFTLPYKEFDNLFPEVREYLIERWPQVQNGSKFMWPETRIQAFMNCAPEPEMVNYDAINDVVLKDIERGEEIFEDYRKIKGWETIYTWLLDKKA